MLAAGSQSFNSDISLSWLLSVEEMFSLYSHLGLASPQYSAVATCHGVAPPTNQYPQAVVAELAGKKSDWPTLDVIQGLSNGFPHFIFYF